MTDPIASSPGEPVRDQPVQYVGVDRVDDPLVFISGVHGVGYDETVEVTDNEGRRRPGTVLEVHGDTAVVQVLGGTMGLSGAGTRTRFLGRPFAVRVSQDMLGRVFDGLGRPIDGGPAPYGGELREVSGRPVNPAARAYPTDFIQTGISVIDGSNSLIRGQKLPVFSGSGMPHDRLVAQIVRQATLPGREESFAVILAAMGIKNDEADFFRRSFEDAGVLAKVALFLSPADTPSVERVQTPRTALTLAEYLAFERDMHVLVLMTDMTNYCDALREISSARDEIPARKGYPGHLYSDLAALYERAGRIKGSEGSITLMPILTMPADDISHPVPDLTGYITEGQIVCDRGLFRQGVYPPVAALLSLSRLMKDGVGKGSTREDHMDISNQLYAAYSRVESVRGLASVIGEEELSPMDRQVLAFGDAFEREYVHQGEQENRSIEQTLDLAWQVAGVLPRSELARLDDELLDRYLPRDDGADGEQGPSMSG
ncbi:MAG: V-type ATP synthase subunit B [Candidatus Brocadiaceae bacterium]|nr:V-type ATP synthase subunit B [Candidatus Brocadiaceae bacterium]